MTFDDVVVASTLGAVLIAAWCWHYILNEVDSFIRRRRIWKKVEREIRK